MILNRLVSLRTGTLKTLPCIIFFLGILMIWSCAFAEQNLQNSKSEAVAAGSTDKQIQALSYAVGFFRKYISPVDGDRCPMYPSCSQYSLEAVRKHGLLMGWIMTCDRLVRCGRDEVKLSPGVLVNGARRSYDPLTNNDFWW